MPRSETPLTSHNKRFDLEHLRDNGELIGQRTETHMFAGESAMTWWSHVLVLGTTQSQAKAGVDAYSVPVEIVKLSHTFELMYDSFINKSSSHGIYQAMLKSIFRHDITAYRVELLDHFHL